MADRFYDHLEAALSSYSIHSSDEYNDEEEETEGEYEGESDYDFTNDERVEELACPFCVEDFDVLGLCCHIDADHRMEVKPGICPVCSVKVGGNMASHVITHHENVLKALCNKKHQSNRSRTAISQLRKELQDKHLRIINVSQSVDSSRGKPAADTMLLSFVNNPKLEHRDQVHRGDFITEISLPGRGTNLSEDSSSTSERTEPCFRDEKARRCEYLQELILSTVFDDL